VRHKCVTHASHLDGVHGGPWDDLAGPRPLRSFIKGAIEHAIAPNAGLVLPAGDGRGGLR
jgi:hypothetical protein